jgi:opacity protein-like surface antigen
MKSVTKLLCAAAVALATTAAAASANATVVVGIDSAALNSTGTVGFIGSASGKNGTTFSDTFNFTTNFDSSASSSLVTIELNGVDDIDFSSITLDGHSYTQTGFDPNAESWTLSNASLGAGSHSIVVSGVLATGPSATYTGTLNIAAVPEPGVWGLMLLGFGGVGAMLRSNRRRGLAFA